MKNDKLKILVNILFALTCLVSCMNQTSSQKVIHFEFGDITIFDRVENYAANRYRREVFVVPYDFSFDGTHLPDSYIIIYYEDGFKFDFPIGFQNGSFYVYNCSGYDGNIEIVGKPDFLILENCTDSGCCIEEEDVILRLGLNCREHICNHKGVEKDNMFK